MDDAHPDDHVDESSRRRYEADWAAGSAGSLADYLPDPGSPGYLPTLEELVHIQLEFAWKARRGGGNQPTPLEELLGEFPILGTRDILLRLLKQEFACREAVGDQPTPAEYARRFPALVVTGREVLSEDEPTVAAEPSPTGRDDTGMAVNAVDTTASIDQPTTLPTGDVGTGDEEQTVAKPVGAVSSASGRLPGRGDVVAAYRIEKELGRGGMGVVYESEHIQTGRRVALKLLSPDLAGNAETMERFLREARLAAALSHPRSTFVFEAGEDRGYPYIAMELMPGRTLKDLADDEGPMTVNRAVDMLLDVIDGLAAAHAAGVIHRDVKPSNCFVDSDGRLKVGDYGLSKSLVVGSDLTQSGRFLGTPLYSAPEQVRGAAVDERTDLYAVGATLFTLIAGRAPFTGESAAVIAQIVSDQPPLLSSLAENIPDDLDRIINRSLHKDPGKRFQALEELKNALLPFATGGTSVANLGRRVTGYAIDYLAAGAIGWIAMLALGAVFLVMEKIDFEQFATLFIKEKANTAAEWSLLLIPSIAHILYFAICERTWGRGVGKHAVGLRVIGDHGNRLNWPNAIGRVALFDGIGLCGNFIIPYLVAQITTDYRLEELWALGFTLAASLLSILIFCSVMRPSNGFRGLHDRLTNSRVVRIADDSTSARLSAIPLITPVVSEDQPGRLGQFEVNGVLGSMGGSRVLLGNEPQLDRNVWLAVRSADQAGPSAERTHIGRVARPRWLQTGETADSCWEAYESIQGVPLGVVTGRKNGLPWDHTRHMMLGLATELQAANADGSLPSTLGIEQVWVDRLGNVRLLDAVLEPAVATDDGGNKAGSEPTLNPVRLLQTALELCIAEQSVPDHVSTFCEELSNRADDGESLAWAVGELTEHCERPAQMTWHDRFGLLCLTFCVEAWAYAAGGFLLSYLVSYAIGSLVDLQLGENWPALLAIVISAPLACLVFAGAVGYATRGGPSLWMIGLEIQDRRGKRASRMRCLWRNIVAWFGLLSVSWWIGIQIGVNSMMERSGEAHAFIIGMPTTISGLLGIQIMMFGALATLASTHRGPQDFLAGTQLVHR